MAKKRARAPSGGDATQQQRPMAPPKQKRRRKTEQLAKPKDALRFGSQYTGVTRRGGIKDRPFSASIKDGDQNIYLGTFPDEVTAAKAYDAEARKLRGDQAHGGLWLGSTKREYLLNFPTAKEVVARERKQKELHALSDKHRTRIAERKAAGLFSSRFAGVMWHETSPVRFGSWLVKVDACAGQNEKRKVVSQRFEPDEEEAAARAYDDAMRKLIGPTAHGSTRSGGRGTYRLNFPTAAEVARGGPSHRDAMDMVAASEKKVAQRTAAGEKTSPFQGVMWDRQSRRWHATLHLPNDNRRKLGKSYVCETAAAKDWDKAVRELLGKDAHGKITMSERALKKRPKTWLLNFPTAAEAARLQEQQATKEESKRQHAERTRSNRSKYIGA